MIETSEAVRDLLLADRLETIEKIRNDEVAYHLSTYLAVEILPMLEEEAGLPLSGFGIVEEDEDLDEINEDNVEEFEEIIEEDA